MKLSTIIPTSAAVAFMLTAGFAFAQGMNMNDQPSPQGSEQKSQQGGGMGGMNMGGGKQGGMMGMSQQQGGGMGQDGGKQGGCGMMNNMASLQERVNQLEQRLNASQPQPSNPAKPQ